jgi:hypothetical protein
MWGYVRVGMEMVATETKTTMSQQTALPHSNTLLLTKCSAPCAHHYAPPCSETRHNVTDSRWRRCTADTETKGRAHSRQDACHNSASSADCHAQKPDNGMSRRTKVRAPRHCATHKWWQPRRHHNVDDKIKGVGSQSVSQPTSP